MKKFNFKKSGFTLIELIVVIAIIGILIAITVPRLSTYIQAAQVTAEQAGAKTVYSAAVAYNTDKGDGSGGIQTGYLTTAMLGEFLDANATIVDDSSKVTKRGEYAVHVDTDGTYTVSYWDVSLTSASGKKGDVAKMVDGAFPTSSSSSSSSSSPSPSPSPTVTPDSLPL